MNTSITLATARRILLQLRHDPRTIGLLVGVPSVLMIMLRYVFDSRTEFNAIGSMLLGIFPMVVMFIVTSVATLRERSSGTLERLMSMPLAKLDLLLGYAIAFGAAALVQVTVVLTISLTWLGLKVNGPLWGLVVVAVLDALLGVALGLFTSAFARTEFQAVQFLPAVVFPQLLVCGLLVPRGHMATVLRWFSDVLPLTYAVEGMRELTRRTGITGTLAADIGIMAAFTLAALVLGAATLRRRTA